jgi:ATP-dependent helicase/nuclease subunit B
VSSVTSTSVAPSPLRARFLLGPAGSGKTHGCLAELRAELQASADGPTLILLAPKQATYQLERQLLAVDALPGYARLSILSFERLADSLLAHTPGASPEYLNEEGRVMVLRALLARRQDDLRVFRATARLPGFARQLSQILRELRQHRIEPRRLNELSLRADLPSSLRDKLHDLALLSQAYLDWLSAHRLQDADARLDLAAAALAGSPSAGGNGRAGPSLELGGLWLDGFAEMTPQEVHLLVNLLRHCRRATLAFCLDAEPRDHISWLSPWSVVSQSFRAIHARLAALPNCRVEVEILSRRPEQGRFALAPALAHLEATWTHPMAWLPAAKSATPDIVLAASAVPHLGDLDAQRSGLCRECESEGQVGRGTPTVPNSGGLGTARPTLQIMDSPVRLACCADPEAEAVLAAHEIHRWVRERGGRFRDVAVLLRSFEGYHAALRRAFQRFDLPFFMDRRESVTHHPLAELTRFALRLAAYGGQLEDWLGALKTGLAPATDDEIDELETAARAHGWVGEMWHRPMASPADPAQPARWELTRQRVTPPLLHLAERLATNPAGLDGPQLADALREFWTDLAVEQTLADWSQPRPTDSAPTSVHATVWEQMRTWLENLDHGFRDTPMPLREWLSVTEAGLSGLTVGAVPPALDQVLIGTIDRSRNPNPRLVLLLGLNESVFPARPTPPKLLTETDRADLGRLNLRLGPDTHQQLGQEQYYGYIACTRASEQLIATCALHDHAGRPLNPSPFFERLQRLFPGSIGPLPVGHDAIEHSGELVPLLIELQAQGPLPRSWAPLVALPTVAPVLARAAQLVNPRKVTALSAECAARLYGAELRASITALEEFAACPFKFFVARGLRAAEREEFQVDPRERGSFQHEVLKTFHQRLQAEGRRWRDLSATQAGERVAQIAADLLPTFREGLLDRKPADRLAARLLIENLRDAVEAMVSWMPQYSFDPSVVEVAFGLADARWPGWSLGLEAGRRLVLRGRIDRVDLCPAPSTGETLAVVIDYKSRGRTLDATRLHHGLELQLLAYLNALVHTASGQVELGQAPLRPAGAFYVGLRAEADSAASRSEARAVGPQARTASYQHTGRFLADALGRLDNRPAPVGDQFRYRRRKDGGFDRRGTEALPASEFNALLALNETFLRRHAEAIFRGEVDVKPFRIRKATACEDCDYRAICRFDPWLHPYRLLAPPPKPPKPAMDAAARPPTRRRNP